MQPSPTHQQRNPRPGDAAAKDGDWKFHRLSSIVAQAVITLDRRGRVRDWNEAAEILFGYPASEALGRGLFGLIDARRSERGRASEGIDGPEDEFGKTLELMARSKAGDEFPIQMTIFDSWSWGGKESLAVVRNPAADPLAAALLHASRRSLDELARRHREMEIALHHRQERDERLIWQLMHHDPLTGLPNRDMVRERIAAAISRAERVGGHVGVLVIGIHHFKYINDTLGHGIGDFLITTIAARLAECAGPSAILARLDGEEFALLLPELRSSTAAEKMARQLLAVFKDPIAVASHQLVLAASVGISIYPEDGGDTETMIRNAGAAMYLAKKDGGNAWRLYAAEYNACALERLAMEEDLRLALERNEFELHYQPQVDIARGGIDGAEALLRWNRPGHGLVSPARFIPMAEESGLIVPIGAWVLETACRQLRAWNVMEGTGFRVAVNLSARQFRQNNLSRCVQETLRRTAVRPEALELEITESMLIHNTEEGSAVLREFRRQGIRLALDDFGTGYSSLSYLKRFPIDTLKIDQSFVRQIPCDGNDAAIVRAIIDLAHGLGLKVVAEGVETEQQLAFLRDHACDKVQGYLFSPPVEAGTFAEILAAEAMPEVRSLP